MSHMDATEAMRWVLVGGVAMMFGVAILLFVVGVVLPGLAPRCLWCHRNPRRWRADFCPPCQQTMIEAWGHSSLLHPEDKP